MRFLITSLAILLLLSFSSCATRVIHRSPEKIIVVKTLPKQYKVVKIKGKRYYFWNGKHYKKTRRGYIVVRV